MTLETDSMSQSWLLATLYFIGRYLVMAGFLYMLFYRIGKQRFKRYKIQSRYPKIGQIKKEMVYSLLTFAIYGSGALLLLEWLEQGATRRYEHITTWGWFYYFLSIMLMIVLHDAYFYWTHRLMHHPKIFKYVHRLHHGFHSPTPWAAFAFHPFESIISLGIVPLIVFLIPFHISALIIFFSFMTIYNVCIHLGYEVKGMWWFKFQNTTRNHDDHHNNGRGNFGLYFNIWDKTMGTYVKSK